MNGPIHRAGWSQDYGRRVELALLDIGVGGGGGAGGAPSFTPAQFGWEEGDDIGGYLQEACDATVDAGGGSVVVPAGFLRCDRRILVNRIATGPLAGQAGVHLQGQGEGVTWLYFTGATKGIRFNGFGVPPSYVTRTSISDMTLQGSNRDAPDLVGLDFHVCLFSSAYRVTVIEFDTGVAIRDDGTEHIVCQNNYLSRVTALGNNVGFHLKQTNQTAFVGCISNLNLQKGWHIEHCSGTTITGGMWQDQGIPMHIEPVANGSVQLAIFGPLYVECPTPNIIQIDPAPGGGSAGTIGLYGGLTVQGSQGDAGAVIRAENCSLHVSGFINSTGYSKHIRGINLRSLVCEAPNQESGPSLYDLDAISLSRSVFVGGGTSSFGTLPPQNNGTAVALGLPLRLNEVPAGMESLTNWGMFWDSTAKRVKILDSEGGWHTLAEAPFDPIVDLSPWLIDVWDPATLALEPSDPVTELAGTVTGTELVATGGPTYDESADLNDQPVVVFVASNSDALDTGALGSPIGPSGRSYVLTVFRHTANSAASDVQYVSAAHSALGDKSIGAVVGNAGADDTIRGTAVDHITGAGNVNGAVALGTTGHCVERYFEDISGYKFRLALDGTLVGTQNFPNTVLSPIARVFWGTTVPDGGSTFSDLEIALEIVCHSLPPATVRARLKTYVAERFGLTLA